MPKKKMKGGMYRGTRKSTVITTTPVGMQGEGFFGDVWNGIKKGANWVKDNNVISKGLNVIGGVVPGPYGSVLRAGSGLAGSIGLGKKKGKGKGKMAGRGMGGAGTVMRF